MQIRPNLKSIGISAAIAFFFSLGLPGCNEPHTDSGSQIPHDTTPESLPALTEIGGHWDGAAYDEGLVMVIIWFYNADGDLIETDSATFDVASGTSDEAARNRLVAAWNKNVLNKSIASAVPGKPKDFRVYFAEGHSAKMFAFEGGLFLEEVKATNPVEVQEGLRLVYGPSS